jgi:yjeF C-terminal region, hydroxyethylthiazole kinase-related/yjeF N-terminal region
MLITCEEMRHAEEAAFARGVQAEDLMEEAGRGVAEIVRQFHRVPGLCIVFCGKGHNAGDALVAARYLASWGWVIDVRFAFTAASLAPLTARKLDQLTESRHEVPQGNSTVLLDGLLGIGAKGKPRGEIALAIESINRLRQERGAWVLAIDIPSGLDGATGTPASICVTADLTATIAVAKDCLVADTATDVVGRLAVIELKDLPPPESARWHVTTSSSIQAWLPPRSFDLHKGDCGRVGIIAGSHGFTGAARLCSAAAVRAGAGLITLLSKSDCSDVLAASCIPEVMVKTVLSYREALDLRFDSLAIGPGLGSEFGAEILSVIEHAEQPVVIDADAINVLSPDVRLLKHCAGPRLLTPHPGEMERLFPREGRERREWLDDFLAEYPVTLLLKGARTLVGDAQEARFINSSGNPGMASGGMGDVLTGVCAALCPQVTGKNLLQCAVLGAWVCGRAAECAVFGGTDAPESLCASSLLDSLGTAFQSLRAGDY